MKLKANIDAQLVWLRPYWECMEVTIIKYKLGMKVVGIRMAMILLGMGMVPVKVVVEVK